MQNSQADVTDDLHDGSISVSSPKDKITGQIFFFFIQLFPLEAYHPLYGPSKHYKYLQGDECPRQITDLIAIIL